jgi:hypothetical protein
MEGNGKNAAVPRGWLFSNQYKNGGGCARKKEKRAA